MSDVSPINKKIFVSVAGINEDDLSLTVSSAYSSARFPERIFFGIYEQRTDGKFSDFKSYINVKHIKVSYEYPIGLGIARLSAFCLNEYQDYCLQIDAHTIFNKDWDIELIKKYNLIKRKHKKIIISCRPKWYYRNEDGTIIFNETLSTPLFIDHNEHFEIVGRESFPQNKEFSEHYLVSAAFVFAELQIFGDILPDPTISFYGEEHTFALRAVTRGYKIFCIRDCFISTFGKHPNICNKENSWKNIEIKRQSDGRLYSTFAIKPTDSNGPVRKILNGEILGYWGAPTMESYLQYIDLLGFDYRNA